MGIPTFLDRPATTTFFPSVGIPRIIILMLVQLNVNLLKKGEVSKDSTCAFNDFPNSPGGSRKHSGLIQAHAAHVNHMEAVHILGRCNCITDGALIYVICRKTEIQFMNTYVTNQPNQFCITTVCVYLAKAAAPAGHQHDDLCWAYR